MSDEQLRAEWEAAQRLKKEWEQARGGKPEETTAQRRTVVPSPLAEFASSVNRGVMSMADVIPKAGNEALGLLGVDYRIPTFSEAGGKIGLGQEFMAPGLARDVIQAAGETAPAAVATGGLLRQAATMAPNAFTSAIAGGTAGQDLAAGLLAGSGSEVGRAVGQQVGGDTGALIGERVGGFAAPMLSAVPMPKARPNLREMAPTTDSLKSASDDIYAQIDNLGVTFKPTALQSLAQRVAKEAKDRGLDPDLTPDAFRLVQRIAKDANNPLSVKEVETLRKLASGVSASMNPSDSNIGGTVASLIDDFLDQATVGSLNGGNRSALDLLKQARSLVQRRKKTELLQEAVEVAKNQATGFENGLRTQFRSILNKIEKGQLKGWTDTEREALQQVVRGGGAENILKFLGKFGLSEGQATSMLGSAVGIGGGAAIGQMFGGMGGPIGAVMVPLLGQSAKYGAQAMTRNNAGNAAAITALGPVAVRGLLQGGVTQQSFAPPLRAGLLDQVEDYRRNRANKD